MDPPPPPGGQTNICENITFPRTSYVVSKYELRERKPTFSTGLLRCVVEENTVVVDNQNYSLLCNLETWRPGGFLST